MRKPLLLCLLLCLPALGTAWGCSVDEDCIEENSWQLGVAVGIGARTNPLVDGDPIPLVVLPDIAWYGEQAYFDNGELGYQWQIQDNVSTEIFVAANTERAYFAFWHPANLFAPSTIYSGGGNSFVLQPDPNKSDSPAPQANISINDISRRNWSADAGARINWLGSDSLWSATFAVDLLGVHQGYYGQISYQYRWQWDTWHLAANASLTYKSRNLIDYYYGIDSQDTSNSQLWYSADHTWQPSIGLLINKPWNKRWRWVGRLQFSHLGRGMTDSPLVSKQYVASGFIGIGYRF